MHQLIVIRPIQLRFLIIVLIHVQVLTWDLKRFVRVKSLRPQKEIVGLMVFFQPPGSSAEGTGSWIIIVTLVQALLSPLFLPLSFICIDLRCVMFKLLNVADHAAAHTTAHFLIIRVGDQVFIFIRIPEQIIEKFFRISV